MSPAVLLAVGMLGGAGSVARLLIDRAVTGRAERAGLADRTGSGFPLGTLAVNLSGALLLGVLVGLGAGGDTLRLLGTGLLGAYTTFSAWMLETERLVAGGRPRAAAANIAVSLALGLLAVWLGRELGAAI
jgi:CrcB protein